MGEDRVRVRVGDNGVATVALIRSDKHNALDYAMFEELLKAADEVAANRHVRAVVLYGEGMSFCSGLDIPSFLDGPAGIEELLVREPGREANFAQRAAYDWSRVPAPVIAAITGNCFGGGLQIALGADIRIAAPDAKLSIMEVKWGLVPDMAFTQSLPRLVGIDVAKELTFTGRILSGAEADALGLVTRTAPDPFASALHLADQLAERSPDAVRAAKRLFDETWGDTDVAAALALETDLQIDLYGKPNQVEAVAAGVAKRVPCFTDPD